ncbi:MAG: FAD-dependent thymidylate synthase [Dehalococcoidia bacterium]|nr:FAD-dependent thymidylate synthase [Dehalococcoidia bacterium]
MHVALIKYTPDAELTVAVAARLCYSSIEAPQIMEKMSEGQIDSLFTILLASGHLSPFEHATFTFAIGGISRACSHQLVRHRVASYSQQSQRYVSFKKLPFVVPPSIEKKPALKKNFEEAIEAAHKIYSDLMAAGIPAEDARFILPNASSTNLMMTMNARELMHVSSLRLCPKAQWEILQLFSAVRKEVEKVAPRIAAQLQPKCIKLGYCDERESCGIMPTREEIIL